MRLVEAAAVAIAFGPREARGLRRRNARIEIDAAERYQAEGFAHRLDMPCGLPEADGEPDKTGLTPQLQTGLDGLSVSSWSPKLAMRAPPMLIGRMQDQQISVIGLGNLPVQVAAPAARLGPAAQASTAASRKGTRLRWAFMGTPPIRRYAAAALPATPGPAPG
jgi:hypothetical protein